MTKMKMTMRFSRNPTGGGGGGPRASSCRHRRRSCSRASTLRAPARAGGSAPAGCPAHDTLKMKRTTCRPHPPPKRLLWTPATSRRPGAPSRFVMRSTAPAAWRAPLRQAEVRLVVAPSSPSSPLSFVSFVTLKARKRTKKKLGRFSGLVTVTFLEKDGVRTREYASVRKQGRLTIGGLIASLFTIASKGGMQAYHSVDLFVAP